MNSRSRPAVMAIAALLLLARAAGAQTGNVSTDIPIPGGTAAMARALGLDRVPDRARFVAEMVRVAYDTREGQNAATDARLAQFADYLKQPLQIPAETVPVPLAVKSWSDALLKRPVTASTLFVAIMSDRRAALMAHGLAGVDDDTIAFLESHPAILTDVYQHAAGAFAAFADALRIREGRVVPPGGADGVRVWEAVLNEKVTRPDRFIRALYGASQGRVALVYATLAHLDPPRVRFALGSWMPDPARRVEQFKVLVRAEAAHREWNCEIRPFARPSHDPSQLLARVRVTPDGAPAPPAARLFWQRAFDGADLPDDPAGLLRNMQAGGTVDAGWLAETAGASDVRVRPGRFDQLAFGQRVFAMAAEADLPNALVAVRALTRYRMLMLALDRMGVRTPAAYAAAARQAQRVSALDGRRRFVALAEFQSAIAIVGRLQRVRSLDTAAAEALVGALVAIPLTEAGDYGGAVARWIQERLGPALKWPAGADADAQLVRASAGVPVAAAARVEWEGRAYRIDFVGPEQRRLTRARERMGAPTLQLALDLERVATKLSASSVSALESRQSIDALKALVPALTANDARPAIEPPPGLEAPKTTLTAIADKVMQDRTAHAARPLLELSDALLAHALASFVYALDIGSPDGTALLGGDVSRRHDFGLGFRDPDRATRAAWAAPLQVTEYGPWHVAGSLLGLDVGLASLALRRIDTDDLPEAPTLTIPDRETFINTVALIDPLDLTDAGRDAIVAAIARGRARVTALAKDAAAWDEAADEIEMDGWRRRAGRWAIANDATLVPSFLSLVELVYLGASPADLPLDRWGMDGGPGDACLCTEAPLPGRAAIVGGRPHMGLLAAEVADVNLRVAEVLGRRHLPAALARAVLAGAVQDYVDQVRPLHSSDWLTLVRSAQAIPEDRVEDYVAALTTDGPLVADRTPPR
jgi:hypothetical protein